MPRNRAGMGSTAATTVPNVSDDQIAWRNRYAGFKRSGYWLTQWGPKPGEPKCQCPASCMAENAA